MSNDSGPDGVWVVGHFDWNFIAESVHATEIDALRIVNGRGYGDAVFVPFGADIWDVACGRDDEAAGS